MTKNDQTASIDQSVDLTYAAISYVPKFYILAYADRSGNKQLDVDYGNEDPDHLPPTLSASLNGYPAMAMYNGVVHLTHQASSTNHTLWHMTFDGTNWSEDTQVPNVYMNESPGMAVFNGNLYVAHQGSDSTNTANTLWYTVTNGRAWSQDKNIPGVQLNGSPAMAVFDSTLYLFFQSVDGYLWYTTTTDGTNWSSQAQVQGVSMRNSPSAAVRDGLLYVAYHNSDDASIGYSTYNGNELADWSSPSTVGGQASERPIADGSSPALYLDTITNHLMVAYPDASGFDVECSVAPSESVPPSVDPTVASVIYNSNLIQAYADCTGNQALNVVYGDKQTTQALLAFLNGYPAMAVFNGVVHLTHQTSGTDHVLWHTTYDGTSWSLETIIPNVSLNESPGMAVFNGNLYLAHQGSDTIGTANTLWYTVFDGKAWSQDTNISGVKLNGSPAMAVFNNVLYLFFQGTDGSSLWYTTTSDGKNWSPQSQVPGVSMRNSPSAAVRDDMLYVAYHNKDGPSIWYVMYGGKWSQPSLVGGPTTDIDHISDRCSPTLYEDNAGNLMVTYTSAQAYDFVVSVVPPEE
ncbi:hypothetical protein PHO31112_04996 [Pandoraea horticolens]|uniref:PLL-like beta propeller domain-containing protein n=1 Tax=Pandoraea horticolens TaxID=2508298 RepID=A0A5E4Z5E4_9BURK|nr:PQQ-binding-like beta-propeller repeat protein [Pandoraea horticolens]VVE55403.1 hypothetical protein PHO31112_04996 [Pandoraea horticolens]